METFNIQQLIYTKLNPGESPFDKKDFHTTFYPLNLLSSTDVLVIENHIYIPQSSEFSSKQVVYFRPIKEETWMFVYDINLLPNEVDTLGRGGIFLCHVWMFPQKLWQKLPCPNTLLELVNDFKYKSRQELLNSKYIDKRTGNMQPVEIDSRKIEDAGQNIPILKGIFEIQLLLNVMDSLNIDNKGQNFIVSAPENKARELFNKLICYVPNELKVNIGWDTMFDGGRMMDNNKTFVAYQEKAPKGGGGASFIQLSKSKIELAKDFKVSKLPDPFAKWIAACSASIEYHASIEEAYMLSEAMKNEETYDLQQNWNIEGFANTNVEQIGKLFLQKCKKEFKRKISKELSKIVPIKDKLLFNYGKLDLSMFADYLFTIIYKKKISPKILRENIPKTYIQYNDLLVLFEPMWSEKSFDIERFNRLSQNQKLQLNSYALKTGVYKKAWYLELIKKDEILRIFFCRDYQKPIRIISLFRKVLKMNENEINQAGFDLEIIRKVFYFRMANIFKKLLEIFKRRKRRD